MKKLIIKLCIIFIPFGIIVVATNVIIDPANIFSGEKYVNDIANILASGNNADNISNYNERLLQEKFLLKQTQKPALVVMGSSRIMEISVNIFPDKKLFNIGVSHANINDLIALTGLLDSLKLMPQEVVINLDPFLICKGDKGTSEWQTLKTYHSSFLKKYSTINMEETEDEEDNMYKKYYTMLTFEYFKTSLEFLFKKKSKKVENVGKNIPQITGRYSDGSVAYSYAYAHPNALLIANVATSMGIKNAVPEMDEKRLNLLNCLINYFEKKNIKMTFVMLPFHPNYCDEVNKRQNNILNTYETFFNEFAKQHSSNIVGSFSATKTQTNNTDFYDTYHVNGDAIKRIFLKN